MAKDNSALKQSVAETIQQRRNEITSMKAQIVSGALSPREIRKIEKEIGKLEKLNKKSEFWGGLATKAETSGARMQEVGSSMQKAGLHTTAAVWTPAIYLGYRAVKSVKGKSAESDLVTLIKECEEGHAAGHITEEQMKEYIVEFVNNDYRK